MMLVAGIMSGTSADAIDVVLVKVTGREWKTRVRLCGFHSAKYPAGLRRRILEVAAGTCYPAGEISRLNFLLGEFFARACRDACKIARIPLKRLQLIGSHGQTVFHQGATQSYFATPVQATMQLGEAAVIAERTGVTTIADFRPADIAAGGHGAPLVPFLDYLAWRHPKKGRVALNIGGIANITAIPAGGAPEDVIAFDTGPGNMLLDTLAAKISGGRKRYDSGGRLAARGTVDEAVLARLLRQAYFRRLPPKSAGREQFGEDYLEREVLPRFRAVRQGLLNALATATALTADSIAAAIADCILHRFPVQECIVSGGGVRNLFLMAQLRSRLERRANVRVLVSDDVGIPSQAKEAMAFAVLAYCTYHGLPANLPSATGARHEAILGKIALVRR
jgi:anhydro-N-acetylmuramic acid kinase